MDDEGGEKEPNSYTGVESHGEGTTDDRAEAVDHKNTVTGHVQTDTDKLGNGITLKRIVRINHILRWTWTRRHRSSRGNVLMNGIRHETRPVIVNIEPRYIILARWLERYLTGKEGFRIKNTSVTARCARLR